MSSSPNRAVTLLVGDRFARSLLLVYGVNLSLLISEDSSFDEAARSVKTEIDKMADVNSADGNIS